MPTLSFEVGAVFAIDAQPAITSLEAIGQAFTTLETMLRDSVVQTQAAVNEMVAQVGRLADAWRGVGEAARTGTGGAGGAGGGGRGGGGRGGLTDDERAEREAIRQLREDRLNADAINRNEDQIYRRQYAAAQRENADRARVEGLDDGISIPPPPRTGITEQTRARESLPPREDLGGLNWDEAATGVAAGRASKAWKGAGGILHGMRPLIAGLGTWKAEEGAMTEDRAIAQSLQEMGYDPRMPGFDKMVEEMRGRVSGATARTIYSESHGASVLPGTAGQFSGLFNTPEARREAYEGVLSPALKFAEVAEQYHRGTIGESYKAGIGYLAMTGQTTPDTASKGLSQLLALTLATGDTVAQEQNVLKYSLPIGKAAGADQSDIAALTAFMEILGFRGTTAGTGVGQMIMGLTNTGGPVAAQQRRERDVGKAFHDVLNLDPKEMHAVKVSRGKEHDIALRALGMEDPATGKIREDIAPGGHLNVRSMIDHLLTSLKTMTPMQGLEYLRNAYTVRGSREAAELKDPETVKKLIEFLESQKNPQSVDELQKELATRPLQQFEQMLANIANIGNTLATATLRGLNTAFMTTNEVLIGINNFLKENPIVTYVGGWGLLFGGVGMSLGLLRGAATLAARGLGIEGLAGAATTATGGLVNLLGGLTRLSAWLSVLSLKGDDPNASDQGREAARQKGGADWVLWQKEHPSPAAWLWDHTFGNPQSPDPEHHLGLSPRPVIDQERHRFGLKSDPAPVTVNVTMTNNNTLNGVPDGSSLAGLIEKLTKGLMDHISHAASDATGSWMSGGTQPGMN